VEGIGDRTLLINALIRISAECDCLPGKADIIAPDMASSWLAPVEIDGSR
jgi:uncharacterized Fe-S center protein